MRLKPGQIFVLRQFYVVLCAVYDGASATYQYTLYCLNDARIYSKTFQISERASWFCKTVQKTVDLM